MLYNQKLAEGMHQKYIARFDTGKYTGYAILT